MSEQNGQAVEQQAEKKAGPVLKPEGIYRGEVRSHNMGESMSGSPYIEFVVRIDARETEDGEWEPVEPFTRPVTRYLTDGALPITVADLQYLGFTDKSIARLDPDHPKAHSFKGQVVFAKCEHEEYREKPREKWNLQRRRRAATADQKAKIVSRQQDAFAAAMAQALGEGEETPIDNAFSKAMTKQTAGW